MVNRKRQKQNQILFKTIVDFTTQIIYFLGMKKLKIDPNKIIRVKPRMIKEGPDVAPLFTIILGFLLGIVFMSLVSCEEQKSQKEILTEITNVTEYTYQECEYIKVGIGTRAWGTHKGNCKNPIHKK